MRFNEIRVPSDVLWRWLVEVTDGDNDIIHWRDMFSWGQEVCPNIQTFRSLFGYFTPAAHDYLDDRQRNETVGFRPVFELPADDDAIPDGAIITAATLYVGGQPLEVPKDPNAHGDIPYYNIPGIKLSFQEALDDPAYQIQAIKLGRFLVADRVLIRDISWYDLYRQGFCKGPLGYFSVP